MILIRILRRLEAMPAAVNDRLYERYRLIRLRLEALQDDFRRRLEWSMQAGRFNFFYKDPGVRLVFWARWAEREYGVDSELAHRAILYGLRHLFSGGTTWTPNRGRRNIVSRTSRGPSSRTGRAAP